MLTLGLIHRMVITIHKLQFMDYTFMFNPDHSTYTHPYRQGDLNDNKKDSAIAESFLDCACFGLGHI